jgi:hypothetical protein
VNGQFLKGRRAGSVLDLPANVLRIVIMPRP